MVARTNASSRSTFYTEAIRVQRDFVDAYIGRARLLMQVRDYL
jgi:hypothetical protein